MKAVKKSFNLNADLAQKLDDFLQENPGLSFTLVMSQALEKWLRSPELSVKLPKSHTDDDVDRLIAANSDLMDELSK